MTIGMNKLIEKSIFSMFWVFKKKFESAAIKNLKEKFKIPESVEIFYPIVYVGNITIGENTYLMKYCELITGNESKIVIGANCAIAKNVTIRALTHKKGMPFYRLSNLREDDVVIGDNCWIGANVFIKEGVVLGSDCIVGANSVVTKSFPDKSIIGGVPAKLIGFNS